MQRFMWLLGLLGLLAALPGGGGEPQSRPSKSPSVKSYSTHFKLDEDPISENGNWINGAKEGIDWYNVITRNGVAHGAVSTGDYTNPTALLTGTWGPNQFVKAKMYSKDPNKQVLPGSRDTLAQHVDGAPMHGVRGLLEMPEDEGRLRGNCAVERQGQGLDFASETLR